MDDRNTAESRTVIHGYGGEPGNMGIQEFVNKKLVRTAALDAPG